MVPANGNPGVPGNPVRAQASISFQGPLPPPEFLARYDDVLANGAERIMALTENQSAHRQGLERSVVTHGLIRQYLGLLCGFVVAVVGYLVGWQVIVSGHEWGGVAIFGIDTTAVVGTFVYGTRLQRSELVAKAENVRRNLRR